MAMVNIKGMDKAEVLLAGITDAGNELSGIPGIW